MQAEALRRHLDGCIDCATAVAAMLRGAGPRPSPSRAPGSSVGRYRVVRSVGRGAMGVVLLAEDPRLRRELALKLLRCADRSGRVVARLRRESRALATLADPHVTAVFDVGQDGDDVFVAMEFVDGATLRAWLAARPRRLAEILDVFEQAARGLRAAHRAGLVHRDFKPENVLVGRDGRVRVSDFGLARIGHEGADTDDAEVDDDLVENDRSLTGTGALVGTPAYMAPELFEGGVADARSDQFAWGVALYEALVGARPFDGDTLPSLSRNVSAGAVRPMPRGCAPRRVRSLVMRALARDPAGRWPDLDAVIAVLEASRSERRRGTMVAVAAGGIAALALAASAASSAEPPCPARAIDVTALARVGSALVGGDTPTMDAALRMRDALEGFAATWGESAARWCAVTDAPRVRAAALECLEDRAREFDAVLAALDDDGTAPTGPAALLVAHLSPVAPCDRADVVDGPTPPMLAQRADVAALRERLAEAGARLTLDHRAAAETLARAALHEAEALGYAPLRAEALLMLARTRDELVDPSGAGELMLEAAWAAEAAGHDRVAAQAWTQACHVLGYAQGEHARGFEAARHAEAAIERAGDDPLLASQLRQRTALLYAAVGELDRAVVEATAAVELAGDDALERAASLGALVSVQSDRGDYGPAAEHAREALRIYEARLGPMHPELLVPLTHIGRLAVVQGDGATALPWLQRALSVVGTADGQTPATSWALLGSAYSTLGANLAAATAFERALAINEQAGTAGHPERARLLVNYGGVLGALDRWPAAEAASRRAVELAESAYGSEHLDTATFLYSLGDAIRMQDRQPEAIVLLERARAIYARHFGPAHPDRIALDMVTGATLGELGRWPEAIAVLEAAWGHVDAHGDPRVRADLAAYLGQALWEGGGDRERAVALVRGAIALYRPADRVMSDDLGAWLRQHGASP